jgi:uncharacterized protein
MNRKANQSYHGLPRQVFDELAAGGGGEPAARVLTQAERSKHVTLLRGVLASARAAGGEQARLASRGYDLLARVHRHDPVAAETVIRSPAVGAWARQAVLPSGTGPARPEAQPGRMGAVAAAAAIHAGFPAEIEVPLISGTVTLPTLGAARADGETAIVRTGPGSRQVCSASCQVELPADPHQDAPGWQGLRRVRTGSLDIVIDDLDPFRMKESGSLAPRLTVAQAGDLAEGLRDGWRVLESHHPVVAAEIAAIVTTVVPYLTPAEGQVSASAAENFGAVALSSPDDPSLCAAILAHEIQHLKLSAVLDLVSLTLPDGDQRFYAPWRADPRPASGLLQGAYAFLGVSAFWRRQRQFEEGRARLRADTEFARWRAAAARAAGTLCSTDLLTPVGRAFVERMKLTLAPWQDEPVLPEARIAARRAAEAHETQWRLDNSRPGSR